MEWFRYKTYNPLYLNKINWDVVGLSHIYVGLSHIGRYKPTIFTDPFGMVDAGAAERHVRWGAAEL